MPVAVRNLKRSHVVFSDIPSNTAIEWKPAGDLDGEDIQSVPQLVLEHPRFLRAVGIGIFELLDSESPELVASTRRLAERYRTNQRSEQDAITALLERSSTGREIVITEAQMDAHIASLSKGQGATIDPESDETKDADLHA